MAKLYADHQFFGWIGPVWLIEELAKYGLEMYGVFIAYSQLVIGYLLVTTRYKLLGSIMMIPLIGNILMVTISLQWNGTPLVLGFLLLLDLIILYQYRDFINPFLSESNEPNVIRKRNIKTFQGHLVWLASLGLQILSIQISYYNWVLACGVVILGLLLSYLSFRVDKLPSKIPKL